MKKGIILFIAAAVSVFGAKADVIKGSVKDTEGKGIAGVVVSDGLNTTVTDAKGKFRMDADQDSRFVFISTPSGYISATLEGNTLFYKEINADTKKYDFIVEKNAKDDTNHNIIAIADPQISDRDELPELDKHADDIAAYVKDMDGDYTFGLCLGDIVGWDHTIYPEYNKIMSKTGIDYRYVIGNHDMTNYGRSHETSMKNYEDMYGPCWYSFNVGKVHYIVLNDNFFIGRDWYYIGYLDERQMHTRIYIDASRSMAHGSDDKAVCALKLAAAFAYLSVSEMEKVSISPLRGNTLEEIAIGMVGKDSYLNCVGRLNALEFDSDSKISEAIVPSTVGRGDGYSILIFQWQIIDGSADFLTEENFEAAIDRFAEQKRDILCVQILAREELNPQMRGKMHLFDSEDGAKFFRKKIDQDVIRAYKDALKYVTDRIRSYCEWRGGYYMFTPADAELSEIFFDKFIDMGVVK